MGERRFCYRCMEKFDMNQHICPHCGFDDTTPYNPDYIPPGTILHERYIVGVLLEYNGEGATYIAHDISTGCKVLLREYMPVNFCTRIKNKATISVNYNNLAKYKAFMAEFTELNKSLAQFRNNSNINPVLDMFADNNTTYTVFEYIEGVQLIDYLKDNAGELTWAQVSKIFPTFFTTMGILHNAGILHRAVSPETVFITDKGELRLTGFCVSAVRTADSGLEYQLFKGYAAPEQYSASINCRQGTWTDVYSVCALLYRCLTGCMPVDSISRLKNDDLCAPDILNPNIPHHVSKVIMEGMDLSGRDRIQTITELVTRLFEQPVLVKPAEPVQEIAEPEYPEYYQGNMYNQNEYYEDYEPPVRNQRRYDERYDEEPEKESIVDRLKVPVIITVLLLAILVIIVAFLLPVFRQSGSSESSSDSSVSSDESSSEIEKETLQQDLSGDVQMPELTGKFLQIAMGQYEDYFTFDIDSMYDNDIEMDMIVEQSIDAGKWVAKGSLVKLVVCKGKEGADIPEYEGLTVSQYENKLKKAGISNYSMLEMASGYGVPDSISQLQVDGKQVNPGEYFSNKEGKKLIVYYLSKDSDVKPISTDTGIAVSVPASTEQQAVSTTVPPKTEAPKTEAPKTEPPQTEPPRTEPPQTEPPRTDPPQTEPPQVIEPPQTDPPEGGGDVVGEW